MSSAMPEIAVEMPRPKAHIEFTVWRKELPVRCHECGAADWHHELAWFAHEIQKHVDRYACGHCGNRETVYRSEE